MSSIPLSYPRIAGLDISTYVGMSLVGAGVDANVEGEDNSPEKEDRGKVVHFPKQRGWKRLHLIAAEVRRTLDIWEPQYAVVEGYAYGNQHTLVALVEVGTVVRGVLYSLGIRWYEVPPTTLKLLTAGKGNAKKKEMADAVKARWGFESPSDDIVDAFALAKMGQLGEKALLTFKGVARGG